MVVAQPQFDRTGRRGRAAPEVVVWLTQRDRTVDRNPLDLSERGERGLALRLRAVAVDVLGLRGEVARVFSAAAHCECGVVHWAGV